MVATAELLVVDASVATKWHLPDEADADLALRLLDRFADGTVQLIAPQHIRAEVPSAITVATRGREPRITRAQGDAAMDEFLALALPTVDDDALVRAAAATAHEYGCAFYDGLYLALAQRLGVRFILADERFHRLIRHVPLVVWLGDYT
jgi:predicted nucleic acid-binding protein